MKPNSKLITGLVSTALILFPGLALAQDGLNGANTSWILTRPRWCCL